MQDIIAFDETINKLNQSTINIINLSNKITNTISLSNSCKNIANIITHNFNNNFTYNQAVSSDLPYYFLNPKDKFILHQLSNSKMTNTYFYFNNISKIKSFNVTVIINNCAQTKYLYDKIVIRRLDRANNADVAVGVIDCGNGYIEDDSTLSVSCVCTKIFPYTPSNKDGIYYLEYQRNSKSNTVNAYIAPYNMYIGMELIN